MGLINWWKTRPLWLKGGIIGLLFVILTYVVAIISIIAGGDISLCASEFKVSILSFTEKITGLNLVFHQGIICNSLQPTRLGSNFLLYGQIILPILVGILIGLIISKIKSRN